MQTNRPLHSFGVLRIAVLGGDGIGPEVTAQALRVLLQLESQWNGMRFELRQFSVGAGEYLQRRDPLPDEVLRGCRPLW